jgi:NitT/TauT family transport system permease protein
MIRWRAVTDFAAVLLAGAILWQGASWIAGPELVVPPLATLAQIGVLLQRPTFWGHAEATLLAWVYAAAIAVAVGVGFGAWLGSSRNAGETGESMLMSLGSLPKVTLYPVILMFCGLSLSAKVTFGVLHGVVPITLFTMGAVRNISPVVLRIGRLHNLSPQARLFRLMIPAAFPEIFSGIRIGLSVTLLGVILGEMFASTRGLGTMLMAAIGLADLRSVAAITLILISSATLLSMVMIWLDRRIHHRA